MAAPKNDNGVPLTAPTFLYVSEQARLKGYRFVTPQNSIGILDVEVTTQLLVQGGQFWKRGGGAGDYADFSVVDKNDVLGLHTANNIPIGTPIELRKYVDAFPFPEGNYDGSVIMPTVAPVLSGLFMRITYHNTGSSDAQLGIVYRWYESGD